jgi:hypothetical protein
VLVAVVGSGLITTFVNLWFQKTHSAALERQRTLLQRGSRLHEKQIDAMAELYAKLWLAHHCLLRAHDDAEPSDREAFLAELERLFHEAARSFYPYELVLPDEIGVRVDAIMAALQDARLGRGTSTDIGALLGELKVLGRRLLREGTLS